MKNKNKNVLVVAAHADDEVLGCGGTLAKLARKKFKINTLILADGVTSRNKNKKQTKREIKDREISCQKSCKILGISKPTFFNFPDNQLDSVPLIKIIKLIEINIKKHKPGLIFTHCPEDLNIDHRLVSKAVITACRPMRDNPVNLILFFEVPSSTEWQIKTSRKSNFNPNWFEDISNTLKFKLNAIKMYKKELRKWPHPRSLKGIKTLAEWRGASSGYKAAEAFILGRKK
tara:strand:+ start:180 stop:872 length:693 start_codon:yes stop_codon:yes gene_type:complete